MEIEQKIKWAAPAATVLWALLMWGVTQSGYEWPSTVVYGAIVLGGVGFAVTAVIWIQIAWMWLRKRGLKLGPAIVISTGLAITIAGLAWAAFVWSPKPSSPITFQKFVLYFVKWDDGIYRLGAVGQLLNSENKLFVIDAIEYDGRSWTLFPRGEHLIQRYTEFYDQNELPEEVTYLRPMNEAYFKKLLKIRIFMTNLGGGMPNLLLRGHWRFMIGDKSVVLSPLRFAVAEEAISRDEWDKLDPNSAAPVKAVAIPARPDNVALGSPIPPVTAMYLVFSPDPSATIDNPYLCTTSYIKSKAGVMVFVIGNKSIPMEQGWEVLGSTYREVWGHPETLTIYNSIYPPGNDGRPRVFGYFLNREGEMLGGAAGGGAPTTRCADIIEMQAPQGDD